MAVHQSTTAQLCQLNSAAIVAKVQIKNLWLFSFLLVITLLPLNASALFDDLPIIGLGFPFELKIEGDKAINENLTETIKEQRKQSQEYKALTSQRSVARFDRTTINHWLESEGFYSYTVKSSYSEDLITHTIDTGPAYIIKSVKYRFPKNISPPDVKQLSVSEGNPLRAEDVLKAQNQLRSLIQQNECLYNIQVEYNASIDNESHEAYLQFIVRDSPQVKFGRAQITGVDQVEPDYLRKFLTYDEGDCFKRKTIEETRIELLQTNLLVRVEAVVAQPEDDNVVVTYNVTERNHRTIQAGVGYDTNTGPGYSLGWQHRNLFHHGEQLSIDGRTNDVRKELTAELVKQHFWHLNQTLTITGDLYEEKAEAYTYTSGTFGASIDRPLTKKWTGNAGVSLEFSRDERDDQTEDYLLFSTPLILDYNRDNILTNPSEGWGLSFQVEPFIDLYNNNIQFTKTSLTLSTYIDIGFAVTALRYSVGTISGEPLGTIPSAHRYYVGGGGSVRGYAYQTVGPLEDTDDKQNVPTGGLSFAEGSLEFRFRLSESWGLVAFADGGYAYPDEQPKFGTDFLWGAGVGVRYFTSFAPFRFDIATPLDTRRDENGKRIDDSVQVYISIGQAF